MALVWSQIDFPTARITVHRLKGSRDATHPLLGDELRALRQMQRDQPAGTRFVLMSERGAPMTEDGFRTMLRRVGRLCGLPRIHPHMLRHSCGFDLADKGTDLRVMQDYLGHRQVQHTVRYTTLAPGRFDRIWD